MMSGMDARRQNPVLLFDVMSTLVLDPFYEHVPRVLGMTLDELLQVKHPTAWVDFEKGHISEQEFLDGFFRDRREYDQQALLQCMRSTYRYLDGIEPLLHQLKSRSYEMHLLSNYSSWYQIIEEELRVSEFAEWSFVSCDLGLRKPDPQIFQAASDTLRTGAEALLFIDDQPDNCQAARQLGIDSIHFKDAAQLRQELHLRGLL